MSAYAKDPGILRNPEVLDEQYLPGHMLNSDHKISEIQDHLSPTIRKLRPMHLWLYGAPGTGKTATARYVLKKMSSESGLRGIYVNCWQNDSLYSVLS